MNMSRNLKKYLIEEIAKASPDMFDSCKWGETKPAKPIDKDCKTNGHTHKFVVDSFGYGRTDEALDCGYTHWHLITAGKISPDGTHTHELGAVKGSCSSMALVDGFVPETVIDHPKKD